MIFITCHNKEVNPYTGFVNNIKKISDNTLKKYRPVL